MRDFRLRTDLQRAVIGGYSLPLGIVPGSMEAPLQGYTLAYESGQEDEPDSYSFHIVISHEQVAEVLNRAFALLPERVFAIIEIGSRDAYRTTDVYISQDALPREEFIRGWMDFEPFLLEDGSVAAGANSEEPFIEVFLDQWKGVSVHVSLDMRDDVERILEDLGLEEVPQTWPDTVNGQPNSEDSEASQIRQVLHVDDEFSPDVDEVLLMLRQQWNLELNVDPESNVDESGREIGFTLWHAIVIVHRTDGTRQGAYASIWATARSLSEMQELIESALAEQNEWESEVLFTIDRVAHDERPDEMADLAPMQRTPMVHLVRFDVWSTMEDQQAEDDRDADPEYQ